MGYYSTGSLLLEEIVISCGIDGVYAILNAAKQRFDESQQEKAKGSADWWRVCLSNLYTIMYSTLCHLNVCLTLICQMREATLFALSSVSEQLLEIEVRTNFLVHA